MAADHQSIRLAVTRFLESLAGAASDRFGELPKTEQTSQLWTVDSDTSASAQGYTRSILDHHKLMYWALHSSREDGGYAAALRQLLIEAGTKPENVAYGYLSPLIGRWLKLSDPLKPEQEDLAPLANEIADSAIKGLVRTTERAVLHGFMSKIIPGPISLPPNAFLRPITSDELWAIGEINDFPNYRYMMIPGPNPNSAVFELEIEHALGAEPIDLPILKRTLLGALVLTYRSTFWLGADEITQNFGTPGARGGKTGNESWLIRGNFNRTQSNHAMTESEVSSLKAAWEQTSVVMRDRRSYLRLPLARLIDSTSRERNDDGLIDAVIGLESLLTPDQSGETTFRFALTGAQILGSDLESRRSWHETLRRIYQVRSALVHGRHPDEAALLQDRISAENALRECWLAFAGESLKSNNPMLDQVRDSWLS